MSNDGTQGNIVRNAKSGPADSFPLSPLSEALASATSDIGEDQVTRTTTAPFLPTIAPTPISSNTFKSQLVEPNTISRSVVSHPTNAAVQQRPVTGEAIALPSKSPAKGTHFVATNNPLKELISHHDEEKKDGNIYGGTWGTHTTKNSNNLAGIVISSGPGGHFETFEGRATVTDENASMYPAATTFVGHYLNSQHVSLVQGSCSMSVVPEKTVEQHITLDSADADFANLQATPSYNDTYLPCVKLANSYMSPNDSFCGISEIFEPGISVLPDSASEIFSELDSNLWIGSEQVVEANTFVNNSLATTHPLITKPSKNSDINTRTNVDHKLNNVDSVFETNTSNADNTNDQCSKKHDCSLTKGTDKLGGGNSDPKAAAEAKKGLSPSISSKDFNGPISCSNSKQKQSRLPVNMTTAKMLFKKRLKLLSVKNRGNTKLRKVQQSVLKIKNGRNSPPLGIPNEHVKNVPNPKQTIHPDPENATMQITPQTSQNSISSSNVTINELLNATDDAAGYGKYFYLFVLRYVLSLFLLCHCQLCLHSSAYYQAWCQLLCLLYVVETDAKII